MPAASQASARYGVTHWTVGGWSIRISRDGFSGDVRCRLRSKNRLILYAPHALGFRLGHGAEVLNAWIRIDDGVPIRWRDLLPELARLRVAIDGRDMDRPTGEIVWVPAAMLWDHKKIAIQSRAGKRPRQFMLDGLKRVHDDAVKSGCTPEGRFIP